jgi:vacuolar-type H+-ATPase catalytic subunit A/Vma1
MNNYNDNYLNKYNKYRIKNEIIGAGKFSAVFKAAKKGMSAAKKAIDKGRKMALPIVIELKKEMNDKEIKELLKATLDKEDYDKLYDSLDQLIRILKINNMTKLIEHADDIFELFNTIYTILKKVKQIGGQVMELMEKLQKYIKMILPSKKFENKEEKKVEKEVEKEEKKTEKDIGSVVKDVEKDTEKPAIQDLRDKYIEQCSKRYERDEKCRKLKLMQKKYGCK